MSVTEFLQDLTVLRPLVILVAWACALLLVDLFLSPRRKRLGAGGSSGLTPLLAALGLVVVLVFTLLQAATLTVGGQSAFNGMIHVDGFAIYLNTLVLASGLAGIALAYDYLRRTKLERGEYYVLLLFSIAGMMLMTMAADLIMVFLALELLSIPLYVLAGFAVPRPASKTQVHSEEAALKYFLMGVFATGFIVYGVALTFGATATTSLAGIVAAVEGGTANTAGLLIGAALGGR